MRGWALVPATLLAWGPAGRDAAIGAQSVARVAPAPGTKQSGVAMLPPGAFVHDTVSAQAPEGGDVAVLIETALAVNPAIRAAKQRVSASRARVTPAGLLPDPMLMAGIQNLPLGSLKSQAADGSETSSGPETMTMKMIGVTQLLPYPGKLPLRRRAAALEVEASEAALAAATWQVKQEIQSAYYDLAFIGHAFDIVERNQRLLGDFITITESRYGVGSAGQQDVLRTRVEAARLAETAVMLTEDRRAALARLNAVLDRPSETPMTKPAVPARVARAAVADSVSRIRFVSAALGSRAADSPLPPLGVLQETALGESPMLREREAMIAAQAARLELARKEYLPDFDVSLQYGQRSGLPDMVTAIVSVPLPILKGRRQDQFVAEARSALTALEAELAAQKNEIRAEVARLYSALERQRAQLALYVKATIPQGRASLASATASYQVGRVEFLTVLDNQATLFNYETEYFRGLTDFAKTLAELERVVGKEILQ